MIALVLIAAFALLLIYAAVRDVNTFLIPNWISLAIALLFVPAALAAGLSWQEAGIHFATAFGVLIIGMGMFAAGWLGGGDVKLFVAAALWMGWGDLPGFTLAVALVGGPLTLGLMLARQHLGPVAQGRGLNWPILQRTRDMPYGVAIAGGALIYLHQSDIGAALIAAAI